MPKHEQTILLQPPAAASALEISYEALKLLGWPLLMASNDRLIFNTAKKWNSRPQQLIIILDEDKLSITSQMVHGEALDIGGKNKKNVAQFIREFETQQKSIAQGSIKENKALIEILKTKTAEMLKDDRKTAEEVDKAMNLSGSNLYATYFIMAVNVIVFVLMAINGAGIMQPDALVHLQWGSNYAPLTLTGDWWRLITNVFIHFGIIHLLMNMYALYSIGVYLEPMIGKIRYVGAYLCTGVLASLTSLWWHHPPVNSAGASGAIFGMYGLFFALLTSNLIPAAIRTKLLQSIGIFIVYNLVYGAKGGVDNSAHIGGLLSGFIIGYLFLYSLKKERTGQTLNWVLPVAVVATIAAAIIYLEQNKMDISERSGIIAEMKESSYRDNEKFTASYNEFIHAQDRAMVPLKPGTVYNDALLSKLENESLPEWEKAKVIASLMRRYDVSASRKTKVGVIEEYISAREEEIRLTEDIIRGDDAAAASKKLDSLTTAMNQMVESLQK